MIRWIVLIFSHTDTSSGNLKNTWVVLIKNGHGCLGYGTLKSSVKNYLINWAGFLGWYKLREVEV